MTRIRIKRVYEPEAPEDGYRVLVDKLWPRGIRKEALRYDLWAKEIAPTPGLRTWFHAAPEVTLLYASKNAAGNHALILQEYLARATAAAGVTNARYS